MANLPHRPLGTSGLEVSLFSLGSWRTFERIPREQGLAVMQAAREAGITFLDDARYNDETGTAPIPTGYSEVVFGELFRATGWVRDEVVVANKLWWEFWPEQDAVGRARRVAGRGWASTTSTSSTRCSHPTASRSPTSWHRWLRWCRPGVLAPGASATGTPSPWPKLCRRRGRSGYYYPSPRSCPTAWCAPTGCAIRRWSGFWSTLTSASLPPTCSPAERLTGKYLDGGSGRAANDDNPAIVAGKQRAAALVELASEWNVSPASLAFSFALSHPRLSSVLFGATSPEQLHSNVASLEVFTGLDAGQRERLEGLAVS